MGGRLLPSTCLLSYSNAAATGTFPAVQWLRLCPSNVVGVGVISSEGNKFHMPCPLKVKKKKKNLKAV